MMPKTSVSPAAIRNSITPSCSPFSVCSRTRRGFKGKGPKKRRGRSAPFAVRRAGAPLLHRAVLLVAVLVVRAHRLLDLHHRVVGGGWTPNRPQQVIVPEEACAAD